MIYKIHSILALSLLTLSLSAQTIHEPAYTPQPASLVAEQIYEQAQPVSFSYESFSLRADSGMLVHNLAFRFAIVNKLQAQLMPGNMVNTTGDLVEAYRLLPNGEHFSSPAMITLPYDFHKIPVGYTAEDVYSYFYDTEVGHWTQLERMSVDTINHTVTSYTTHFTDFANAVIKTPEMPEANAFVPTAMTDLPDVNPLQGIPMIAAPQANNRGTVELTYPIELPKGRRGLQPNVDLHYSSAGGNGVLGVGWSIQTPAITIDTRWGVPRYNLLLETEEYQVNGDPVLLQASDGTPLASIHENNQLMARRAPITPFQARDSKNQNKIFRYGLFPTDYWWSETDRSGVTYYYGKDLFQNVLDTTVVLRDANKNIGYWPLTVVEDLDGNYMHFHYQKLDNEIYLDYIEYTGNIETSERGANFINFLYQDREDTLYDGRLGLLRETTKRLCTIMISQNGVPFRFYGFDYGLSRASNFLSRIETIFKLDSIVEEYRVPSCLSDVFTASHYVPGTKTILEYNDAPTGERMFAERTSLPIKSFFNSASTSFSIGGTATVGYGIKKYETTLSGGGNYSFSKSNDAITTMMMDVNGDGLLDLLTEDDGTVSVQLQVETPRGHDFKGAEPVKGLSRLGRDISKTHEWGLQVSFVADASFSRPKTKSYTDWFFSDVNADGLPDMVTPDGVLFCSLDSAGIPAYELYDGSQGVHVPIAGTSSCERSIIYDGETDSNIMCHLYPQVMASFPQQRVYENIPIDVKNVIAGNYQSHSVASYWGMEHDLIKLQQGYSVSYADDTMYLSRLEGTCQEEVFDPNIQMVRVWVAPQTGTIRITHSITLQDDAFQSRANGLFDGIEFYVQRNTASTSSTAIQNSSATILSHGAIAASDTITITRTLNNVSVQAGDVICFWLRSGSNYDGDVVDWELKISYSPTSWEYDSRKDFVFSGDQYFSAHTAGTAHTTFEVNNMSNYTIYAHVQHGGSTSTTAVAAGNHTTISNQYSVQEDDSIVFSLSSSNSTPDWGLVQAYPQVMMVASVVDSTQPFDTLTYYPPVRIACTQLYPNSPDHIYHQLFGKLHKGWGHFAYYDHGDDVINFNQLCNTRYAAVMQCKEVNHQNDLVPDSAIIAYPDSMTNYFRANGLYNPIAEDNYWIETNPDSRTQSYIAYGNMGAIGRSVHSNARQLNSDYNLAQDTDWHLSAIPSPSDSRQRVTTLFKSSLSSQYGGSFSMPFLNEFFSGGTSTIESEFMDMNGDGYPDLVGIDGIQYTMPWGGLGPLIAVDRQKGLSQNSSAGAGASASVGLIKKLAGKSANQKSYNLDGCGGGISNGTGDSNNRSAYIDLNADGLPDWVDSEAQQVRYNLGYSFSEPHPIGFSVLSSSQSISASANLTAGSELIYQVRPPLISEILRKNLSYSSIAQQSISLGMGYNHNTNNSQGQLMDVNGDGRPDWLRLDNTDARLYFGKGNRYDSSFDRLPYPIRECMTNSLSINAGVTIGFPVMGLKVETGVHGTPWQGARTEQKHDLLDVNGDGLPDMVSQTANGVVVVLNQSGRTNLLRKVINPTGQEIEVEYGLSEASAQHRQRTYEMSCVLISDTFDITYQPQKYKFHYDGSRYDTYERTDYGYQEVTTLDIADQAYWEKYYNEHYILRGEKAADKIFSSKQSPLLGHRYEYEFAQVENGYPAEDLCDDKALYPASYGIKTDYYEDADTIQITTHVVQRFDRRHNLWLYEDFGDTAIVDDDWKQELEYAECQPNNLISLPEVEVVKGGFGKRETHASYDSLGHLIQIVWGQEFSPIRPTTDIAYNRYGCISQITGPENNLRQRSCSQYGYDSLLHTYVTRVQNQFGEVAAFQYDTKRDLLLQQVDPAGNMMQYVYDCGGRLLQVSSPIDCQHAVPIPTITYSYYTRGYNLYRGVDWHWGLSNVEAVSGDSLLHTLSLYNASGELVQTKTRQNVLGHDTCVISASVKRDVLNRAAAKYDPFVSNVGWDSLYEDPSGNTNSTAYEYDVLNRVLQTTFADGNQRMFVYGVSPDWQNVLRLSTMKIDENGYKIWELYSPQKNLIQTITQLGSTLYTYNAINELVSVEDADGYQTSYVYDELGRLTERRHPDAGITSYMYDPAGNVIQKSTANMRRRGVAINYIYDYNRLIGIGYPDHWDGDVRYTYDHAGRLARRDDGVGSEQFTYDAMGNVVASDREVRVPNENKSYRFRTNYEYDSFGRMLLMTYPDGEQVHYAYHLGGLLDSIYGIENGGRISYQRERLYDEKGHLSSQVYGNGVTSNYTYDPARDWLSSKTTMANTDSLQSLHYSYDHVGNISEISQSATFSGMGGAYRTRYAYDELYRLQIATTSGDYAYDFTARFSPAGRLGEKRLNIYPFSSGSGAGMFSDLIYGYDKPGYTHQPRSIYDDSSGSTMILTWDYNGNLVRQRVCDLWDRIHLWDEENRLRVVWDDNRAGYYGYDANGERVVKLFGSTSTEYQDGAYYDSFVSFDDGALYPSPFVVVTPKGYTKHYFAGSERVASRVGLGSVADTIPYSGAYVPYNDYFKDVYLLDEYEGRYDSANVSIDGIEDRDLNPLCQTAESYELSATKTGDLFTNGINFVGDLPESLKGFLFFYHGDHLGSASWITDVNGDPVQYLHYAPYGELVDNRNNGYDERFKFTGKEKDWESGYTYYGARYSWGDVGIWISVDPLADKYPGNTPYMHCNGNPVMFIDFWGEEPVRPASEEVLGTPQYYCYRQAQYEAFNQTQQEQVYYMSYGYKYALRFSDNSSKFSPKGQIWVQETMMNLQNLMENKLSHQEGTDLELNSNMFMDFAFDSHVDAYWNGDNQVPFYELSIGDWLTIVKTIDFKDLISIRGIRQETKLGLRLLQYYGKELLSETKNCAKNIQSEIMQALSEINQIITLSIEE